MNDYKKLNEGLPDLQNSSEGFIKKKIYKVGINNYKVPIKLFYPDTQQYFNTIATVSAYASLDKDKKGVNMCYDEETEILTRNRGWIFFKDLTLKDEVATLNKESKKLEWYKPKTLFKKDYEGDMYQINGKGINLLVTPNHNLLVEKKGKLELKQAKDIGTSSGYKMLRSFKWEGEDKEHITIDTIKEGYRKKPLKIKTEDFMKIFGFYIAEGCITHAFRNEKDRQIDKKSGGIIFTNNENQILEELKQIFLDLGLNPMLHKDKNIGNWRLQVNNKQLYNYFNQFGKSIDKFVPQDIKELDIKYLKILLEYYLEGDGYKKQNSFSTSSRKLADDMQEIVMKCGKYASIRTINKKHGFKPGSIGYIGYISERKTCGFNGTTTKTEWVKYKGKIYCCEVKNNTLLVRRTGVPVWSGNSRFSTTITECVKDKISSEAITNILNALKKELECENIYVKFYFNYLIKVKAPSSKIESWFNIPIIMEGTLDENGINKYMTIETNFTSCCPCSRDISVSGAHNQRSLARIKIHMKEENINFEELKNIVDNASSCPIYNSLKRTDEKFVTEKAYKNAKFSEDICREITEQLDNLLDKKINDYVVVVENFESIHQSNAVSVMTAGRVLK